MTNLNLLTPRALFSPIFLQCCCPIFIRNFPRWRVAASWIWFNGSRSTQYANPKNYISTKHVDSALFAVLKLPQLKGATGILFPASKLYRLGTIGYPPIQNLAPMSYASTVMWCDVVSEITIRSAYKKRRQAGNVKDENSWRERFTCTYSREIKL